MHGYLSFLVFAFAVAVAPGPDSFLTLRNTVTRGRGFGLWTALGICLAGALQGTLAAAGLSAVIARSEVVFQTIRWAGVVYLVFLGLAAIRAAVRVHGTDWSDTASPATVRTPSGRVAMWQGFLCNITNPKVLAFNLAVLPQFAGSGTSVLELLFYALTLTVAGAIVLLTIVLAATRARAALQRKRVQRGVEGATGVVMLGFAAALATES